MLEYNGSEGEAIALDEGAALTANYRKSKGDKAETVRAHFFGRDILQDILNQENCAGIRMYYGLDENEGRQQVLVGVAADGQDMEAGIVADRLRICPPDCAVGTLNG